MTAQRMIRMKLRVITADRRVELDPDRLQQA